MEARKVSLFRNGRSQALRIPKEFEFAGSHVTVRKDGDTLVVEPVRMGSLIDYLRTKEPCDEPWPEIDDPLPEPVEL